MCSWCCEERARAPRTALWGTGRVGWVGLGASGRVCRVIRWLRGMHEAAPASVSCLASHIAFSVSLRTAR
eukprot:5389922-Prymnesium_polylepis.1